MKKRNQKMNSKDMNKIKLSSREVEDSILELQLKVKELISEENDKHSTRAEEVDRLMKVLLKVAELIYKRKLNFLIQEKVDPKEINLFIDQERDIVLSELNTLLEEDNTENSGLYTNNPDSSY